MPTEPTVYVVDDDDGMRKSTMMLLKAAGIPCQGFTSADEYWNNYTVQMPGCLILDLSMPGMGGLELVERLRAIHATIPIVIVSGTGNIPLAVQGMKMGVVDFLEKPVDPNVLLGKVRLALDLDAKQRAQSAADQATAQRLATLTLRERELIKLVVRGLSNKQIAQELKISVKTVDNHRTRAMRKTGALNAADLTRIAIEAKFA